MAGRGLLQIANKHQTERSNSVFIVLALQIPAWNIRRQGILVPPDTGICAGAIWSARAASRRELIICPLYRLPRMHTTVSSIPHESLCQQIIDTGVNKELRKILRVPVQYVQSTGKYPSGTPEDRHFRSGEHTHVLLFQSETKY